MNIRGRCKVFHFLATNQQMKKLLSLLFVAGFGISAFAQTKILLNLDKAGVALQGYDPVSFFADKMPAKGKPEFSARRDGAVYYFATREHQELFNANPSKYEPAFGGYCAFGVSRGKLVEIDVNAFQIVDGRLLLQYSKSVRESFNTDTKGNLAKADGNWPGLVEKKGK